MAPVCVNYDCLSSNVKPEQAYYETFLGFSSLFHGHLRKMMTGIKSRVERRNVCEEDHHGC